MVNVTDSTNVYVGFVPLKGLFCHFYFFNCFKIGQRFKGLSTNQYFYKTTFFNAFINPFQKFAIFLSRSMRIELDLIFHLFFFFTKEVNSTLSYGGILSWQFEFVVFTNHKLFKPFLERKTGLEPATWSLEGYRSTKWATSALKISIEKKSPWLISKF